jgi:hypothetical protein
MQNKLPIDLIYVLKKQSTQFYLLVGGTVLLLAWLSVGLTPSTWWLLFQVIGQFKVLSAQYGMSAVWALLILIGQSLLLLAAWVLLIRIMVRGSARFSTYYEPPVSAQPVFPPSSASPSAQGVRTDERSTVIVPPEPPVRVIPQPSSVQSVRVAQTDQVAEIATQITPLPSPDIQRSAWQKSSDPYAPTSIFGQDQQAPGPDLAAIAETQRAQRAQNRPPGRQAQIKQSKWQSDDPASDPFAPHEDILAWSLQDDPLLAREDHPEQTPQIPPVQQVKPEQTVEPVQQVKQTAPADEKEDVFVFGNPFEGTLPDVFEHDDDLKRSLKEENSRSRSNDKGLRVKYDQGLRIKKQP